MYTLYLWADERIPQILIIFLQISIKCLNIIEDSELCSLTFYVCQLGLYASVCQLQLCGQYSVIQPHIKFSTTYYNTISIYVYLWLAYTFRYAGIINMHLFGYGSRSRIRVCIYVPPKDKPKHTEYFHDKLASWKACVFELAVCERACFCE